MNRRDWLRRLAAAGAAGVVPGSDLAPALDDGDGRPCGVAARGAADARRPNRAGCAPTTCGSRRPLRPRARARRVARRPPTRRRCRPSSRCSARACRTTPSASSIPTPTGCWHAPRPAPATRASRTCRSGGTQATRLAAGGVCLRARRPRCRHAGSARPPAWESAAFATEAIETYWMALLRDVPFGAYDDDPLVARAAADLTRAGRRSTPAHAVRPTPDCRLPTPESRSPALPALSSRSSSCAPCRWARRLLSPRVAAQAAGESFLSTWDEWLASQNGRLPSREATYTGRRYICCGRDLATWTRTDYPGQAGVQAALLLEALRAPVTPQHPYVRSRNQAGYVTFGLPFIVDLASRVAMHALRASWFQKWVLHRRLRPEELGGRLEAGGRRRADRGVAGCALRPVRRVCRGAAPHRHLPAADGVARGRAAAPGLSRRRTRRRPARWSPCSRRTTPRNG